MPTQALTQLGVSSVIVVFLSIAVIHLWNTVQKVREDRDALADRLVASAERMAPILSRANDLLAEISGILRDLRDDAIRSTRDRPE